MLIMKRSRSANVVRSKQDDSDSDVEFVSTTNVDRNTRSDENARSNRPKRICTTKQSSNVCIDLLSSSEEDNCEVDSSQLSPILQSALVTTSNKITNIDENKSKKYSKRLRKKPTSTSHEDGNIEKNNDCPESTQSLPCCEELSSENDVVMLENTSETFSSKTDTNSPTQTKAANNIVSVESDTSSQSTEKCNVAASNEQDIHKSLLGTSNSEMSAQINEQLNSEIIESASQTNECSSTDENTQTKEVHQKNSNTDESLEIDSESETLSNLTKDKADSNLPVQEKDSEENTNNFQTDKQDGSNLAETNEKTDGVNTENSDNTDKQVECNTTEASEEKCDPAQYWGLLLNAMERDYFLKWDNQVAVIKEKQPKAKFHYLIVPKENVRSLSEVTKTHIQMFDYIEQTAKKLISEPQHEGITFKMGYIGQPTMIIVNQKFLWLHMHVISDDMNSEHLTLRKHWNLFNSDIFIDSSRVRQELENTGEFKVPTPETCKDYLNGAMKCHKCDFKTAAMRSLKKHLKTHLKK